MRSIDVSKISALSLTLTLACGGGSDQGTPGPGSGTGGGADASASGSGGGGANGIGGNGVGGNGVGGDGVGGASGGPDAGVAGTNGAAGNGTGGAPSLDGGTGATDSGSSTDAGTSANTGGAGGSGPTGGTSKKLDLLLVVDNSISMSDKQAVLRVTVPDLVQKLTDTALGLEDLHVGAITSSLGGYGTTTCQASTPLVREEQDDLGQLVGARPRAAAVGLASGFATWSRPDATTDLVTNVQNLVAAAGEFGCGLEATLEATYHFLADPAPYASIEVKPCSASTSATCAFPTGVDGALLGQRSAFLRPDSAVAIVVLSDENDCSIRPTSQYFYAARSDVTLPHGSSACATNPNDPCCYSCAQAAPSGCTADPTCANPMPASQDPINLRCFEQKRRFGLDMLFPVARYTSALRNTTLCTSRADLDASAACPDSDGTGGPDVVRNPLFPDPATAGGPVRDPSMVYLLGVVGVPWQTIRATEDASGAPLPSGALRYRTGSELATGGIWPLVLGDPSASPPVPPGDPLMLESIDPRTGTTPGTGEALADPSAGYLANSVNGHEWAVPNRDDLQLSCIFPLTATRDCTDIEKLSPAPGCDCSTYNYTTTKLPLCQDSAGVYSTVQRFAKSYPGLRHLALVKALGDNASLASICARNLTDDTKDDYGYRPAVEVMVTELRRSVR